MGRFICSKFSKKLRTVNRSLASDIKLFSPRNVCLIYLIYTYIALIFAFNSLMYAYICVISVIMFSKVFKIDSKRHYSQYFQGVLMNQLNQQKAIVLNRPSVYKPT
jgi:hypothetical protein